MNLDQLRKELTILLTGIDASIELVESAATTAQQRIYKAILGTINDFELRDGRYVVNQNFAARIQILEKRIRAIIGDIYEPAVGEYLDHYATVEDQTIALHKSYNDLEVQISTLSPARQTVYRQAEYYLVKGIAPAYIQPIKYLLMQQVTTGITIKDSQRILKNWNEGNLTASKSDLATGRPTPSLQQYSVQIARDAAFQHNGSINEIIAQKFELKTFIYVGGVIEDSRPLCRHLVGLDRKIELTEVPALIEQFPEGVIPGTTRKNWYQRRAGYNCRHVAMPVKRDDE